MFFVVHTISVFGRITVLRLAHMHKNIFLIVGSGVVAAALIITTYVGAGVIGRMDALGAVIHSQQRMWKMEAGSTNTIINRQATLPPATAQTSETQGSVRYGQACSVFLSRCEDIVEKNYRECSDNPELSDEFCKYMYGYGTDHCEATYEACIAAHENDLVSDRTVNRGGY